MDQTLSSKRNRYPKMATAKLLWVIADWIGVPTLLLGILANLDNIKSLILFFLGAIYAGVRIYYTIIEKEQKKRHQEYDLWNKEMDKLERKQRMNTNV